MPSPIVIVGAGLAGLWTALKLAPRPTLIVSSAPLGQGAASLWAQGGIAAALGAEDSAASHVADTQRAGAGLSETKFAHLLSEHIGAEIKALIELGVDFDRDENERFLLSREAGHQTRRIVRSKGERAGQAIMHAITRAAAQAEHIRFLENHYVGRLAHKEGKVAGIYIETPKGWEMIAASAVVLATGGIGQLYRMTTNPPQALGAGLAMAALAGAEIADAEFVQFHPTALAIGSDPAPLATEALRGEGAVLLDHLGHRFMLEEHVAAELAPRDIVARAVAHAAQQGGAFLDARHMTNIDLATHFPIICAACKKVGLDPYRDVIPIAPAAHYHMGGIACNANGRTSLAGLWACGETAATGVHGANRLAGNSLAEALVLANFVALDIETSDPPTTHACLQASSTPKEKTITKVKRLMSDYVGVVRSAAGLKQALSEIQLLEKKNQGIVFDENILIVAKIITAAALQRTESRGAHYREDYPQPDPQQAQHSLLTLHKINAMSR